MNIQATKLDEAIVAFERAVFSPVMAGELADWAERGVTSVEQLQLAVADNAEVRYAPIYEIISESDPDILARVQQLRAEDDALLQCIRETLEIAKSLRSFATAVDRDEAKAANLLEVFVKAAETVSIRLKKQEIAVDVWLRESQTRDRGVKD